jgi:hypothetical protein
VDLFLVTFESDSALARFEVTSEITRYPSVQLSPTSFVVKTKHGNGALFARLKAHLGEADNLYVLTLQPEFSGCGLKSVIDWLGERCEERAPKDERASQTAAPVMPRVMNLFG